MKNIKIGKIFITKKGLLNICLFTFLFGILLGATILFNSIKFNIISFLFMFIFATILWKIFAKRIKNEISESVLEKNKISKKNL